MNPRNSFQQNGLRLVQIAGPAVEVWFDWDRLPIIELGETYFLVEIKPDADDLPVEYARPNSAGPLHFFLKEAVDYRLRLLSVPYAAYQVHSDLTPSPWVELIPQHENLQRLVWSNLDLTAFATDKESHWLEVYGDGVLCSRQPVEGEPVCDLRGRPKTIEVRLESGRPLFRLETNLSQMEEKLALDFCLPRVTPTLFLSRAVSPLSGWRLRAEIPSFYGMGRLWQQTFTRRFPESDPAHIIGSYRLYENERLRQEVRQWGFVTRIRPALIDRIQIEEWQLKQRKPVTAYKMQLQITSAHRELLKWPVLEQNLDRSAEHRLISFSAEEIKRAQQSLLAAQPHVAWDQAFIELVLFFQINGSQWQEFQRDIAHSPKWEFIPGAEATACRAEWVLYDLSQPKCALVVLKSGLEKRLPALGRVFLRPYSSNRLFAFWDLERQTVEETIAACWKVTLA